MRFIARLLGTVSGWLRPPSPPAALPPALDPDRTPLEQFLLAE